MPARSAVSLLAGPAAPLVPAPPAISVWRQCICHYRRYVGSRGSQLAVGGATLPLHSTPPTIIAPSSSLSSLLPPSGLLYKNPTIRRRQQGNNDLASNKTRGNCRHWFHGTPARLDDAIDNARNHYETLKVPPGASAADIKKSFYQLSKTHHPDVHEAAARRAASRRFMRISEAYSILSSPTKRAKYDRDHHINSSSSSSAHPHAGKRTGSYSSTGPAGGRPASGLSRRRGTFQGPPPSFYRSGGWGAQGEKRRAAHEESTGGSGNVDGTKNPSSSSSASTTGRSTMGGMGPGQTPFRGDGNDYVPHFDKEGHERTGRYVDQRREARQRTGGYVFESRGGDQQQQQQPATQKQRRNGVWEDVGDLQPEKGAAGPFFAITGVILLSFVGPFFISRLWRTDDGPTTMKTTARKSAEKRGAV